MALEYRDCRRVGYTVREYFDMVMDVDRYEEFLPYCTASRVIERKGDDEILAQMVLTFRGMRQAYTSCVRTEKEGGVMKIVVSQEGEGPFSVLRNEWIFRPEERGCTVDFTLEMGFGSVFLERLVGGVLEGMGKRMVEAFERRGHVLYGRKKGRDRG